MFASYFVCLWFDLILFQLSNITPTISLLSKNSVNNYCMLKTYTFHTSFMPVLVANAFSDLQDSGVMQHNSTGLLHAELNRLTA